MNTGLALAGLIVRRYLEKEAGAADLAARGVLGAGKVLRGAGKTLVGANKAWGEGSKAVGKSVTQQLTRHGIRGAGIKGQAVGGALKAAPWLVGGYYGYKAFEPEVQSAKQRLGHAIRGRVATFKARRRAASPYYHQGRFQ